MCQQMEKSNSKEHPLSLTKLFLFKPGVLQEHVSVIALGELEACPIIGSLLCPKQKVTTWRTIKQAFEGHVNAVLQFESRF